jgi:hypothetical protein
MIRRIAATGATTDTRAFRFTYTILNLRPMDWTGFRSDDKQDGSARWTPFINFKSIRYFTIVRIGSTEIALTNSTIYMIVAVAVICAF